MTAPLITWKPEKENHIHPSNTKSKNYIDIFWKLDYHHMSRIHQGGWTGFLLVLLHEKNSQDKIIFLDTIDERTGQGGWINPQEIQDRDWYYWGEALKAYGKLEISDSQYFIEPSKLLFYSTHALPKNKFTLILEYKDKEEEMQKFKFELDPLSGKSTFLTRLQVR